MFVTEHLDDVYDADVSILGHCNAGMLTCSLHGFLGPWKMWQNFQGIANLLLIPQHEEGC